MGGNGTVRLWDADSGTERLMIVGFTDGAWIVQSPGGQLEISEGAAETREPCPGA